MKSEKYSFFILSQIPFYDIRVFYLFSFAVFNEIFVEFDNLCSEQQGFDQQRIIFSHFDHTFIKNKEERIKNNE